MTRSVSSSALPDGVLVGFYGDDFTGSTSVMEVLTFAGLPTVLFLQAPDAEQLARFADHRGVGIAGIARSRAPAWMDAHLPPAFEMLATLDAPIVHYKVCSTFDSAPHVGSIGRAIEIAAPLVGGRWHPMIVAAPAIARYQAFGNLFAAVGGEGYRLDRHPTMSRHPVTPMHEADVRLHLARQTSTPVGLVDYLAMKQGSADARLSRELQRGMAVVSLDVIDDETLAEAGRLVWAHRGERLFAIGSQGLEYALIAHWRAAGLLPATPSEAFALKPVDRIACVSGSCSPVTAQQIEVAERSGFESIVLDTALATDAAAWTSELHRVADHAVAALGQGRDPLVFTAKGPDDPALARTTTAAETAGLPMADINDRIGAGLGRVLDTILKRTSVTRAVVAGGDTSGHAMLTLGVYALTAIAPIAPGSPLCRAHSDSPTHAGLEIALKGGQIGAPDFFRTARRGAVAT